MSLALSQEESFGSDTEGGILITIEVPHQQEIEMESIVPQSPEGESFLAEIKGLRQEVKILKHELCGYEKSKERVAELELELEITKLQLRRFQRNEMISLAVRREIALENLRRVHGGSEEPVSQEEIEENDYDTID